MEQENTSPKKSVCQFGQDSSQICDRAKNLLGQAMDGNDPALIKSTREQLGSCSSCQDILDFQLKLRETMSSHLKLSAPKQLRIDISANLKRMDLGELDITDFLPPKSK